MEKNLESYIKNYKGVLDPMICDETVKMLQTVRWEEHSFYLSASHSLIRHNKELSVSWDRPVTANYLNTQVGKMLKQYVKELDLSYFGSLNGATDIRFNRYNVNTEMRIHCDHIHSMFDGERKGIPVLSVVGLLNNDFDGGDFIMFQDTKIELSKGDLLIFPSIFMYPHHVTEVTNGTRYSFVSWAW